MFADSWRGDTEGLLTAEPPIVPQSQHIDQLWDAAITTANYKMSSYDQSEW